MARGSTFVFLKKTDIPVTDEEIVKNYPVNCLRKAFLSIDKLHRYTCFDDTHYADKEKHILLYKIFDVSFNSTFTCLKEEFDLNAYSTCQDKIVFTETHARAMLQAIKYLYNGDYSSKIEELLDNDYIRIFSEMHAPYMKYLHPDWGEDYADGDSKWSLKRLKRLLEAYLCMCEEDDENEYVLLYYAWG